MSHTSAIWMSGVRFAYDGFPVLDDVDLAIRERELVAIVGPNGGGKTTLLKIALGLLKPQRGRVSVLGQPPAQARRRIGYMTQYTRHDPQFPITVMEVVLMARLDRHLGGPYSREDKKVALAMLEEVGVADLEHRLFNALSGGQRQRVLMARALSCEPELLVLDEPTANVDVAVESRFYEILQRLNQRMAVVVATHDLGLVSRVFERVVCVNRRVVTHPTSHISGDVIRELYGGDFHIVRHDHRFPDGGGADG